MVISGTPGLEVSTEKLPGFTLRPYDPKTPHDYTCVIVRSPGKVAQFRLRTRVTGEQTPH